MSMKKIVFELKCYRKVMGFDAAKERVKFIYMYEKDEMIDEESLLRKREEVRYGR